MSRVDASTALGDVRPGLGGVCAARRGVVSMCADFRGVILPLNRRQAGKRLCPAVYLVTLTSFGQMAGPALWVQIQRR